MLEDIVFAYALNVLPVIVCQYILHRYKEAKHDGWLILRRLIETVTISTNNIWIKLIKTEIDALQTELSEQAFNTNRLDKDNLPLGNPYDIIYPAETQENHTTITCKIAIQIKRYDGRRYILAPDGNAVVVPNVSNPSPQLNTHQSNAILQAIAEVHAWKEQLENSNITVKQLAKQIGKSDTYLYGRLKLLYLSPTILKRITTHSLSPIISIKDLLKAANHLDWKQQHHYLSIPQ